MHVPAKSGVVSFVMSSVLLEPESVAEVKSGAEVGAEGAVVSSVIDRAELVVDTFPAVSVCLAVML